MPYIREDRDRLLGEPERTHTETEVFHGGRLRISRKLFAYLLQLPDHWHVVSFQIGEFGRSIDLYIEGADLPAIEEGADVGDLPDIAVKVHTLFNATTYERFFRYEVLAPTPTQEKKEE